MHSSWSESSRIIPTRYETEFSRPRYEFSRPGWISQSPRWDFSTEMAPFQHSTPPFPTQIVPAQAPAPLTVVPQPFPSSSLVHYPTREQQTATFENEIRRMNDEMSKMMNTMQPKTSSSTQLMAAPPVGTVGSVEDWRLTDNFRMENPIRTYGDGSRQFELKFDLSQFKPEEIQVRTKNNTLTVSAKHDEKDPNKSVFREYNRSYVVPNGVTVDRLTSTLGVDGTLTVKAPLPALEGPREKLIAIKHS